MRLKVISLFFFCKFQDQKHLITIKPKAVEIKFGSETVARCDLKKRGDELSEWDVKKINTLYDCPKDKYPHIETIGNKGISIIPLQSDENAPTPFEKTNSNPIKLGTNKKNMSSNRPKVFIKKVIHKHIKKNEKNPSKGTGHEPNKIIGKSTANVRDKKVIKTTEKSKLNGKVKQPIKQIMKAKDKGRNKQPIQAIKESTAKGTNRQPTKAIKESTAKGTHKQPTKAIKESAAKGTHKQPIKAIKEPTGNSTHKQPTKAIKESTKKKALKNNL